MRFAHFPWRRSLATQLLCTYTAALLIMIATTVGIMWFSSLQDPGVTTQGQLRKVIGLVRDKLQFDTTGALRSHAPFDPDLSWVFTTLLAMRSIGCSTRPVASFSAPTTPPARWRPSVSHSIRQLRPLPLMVKH